MLLSVLRASNPSILQPLAVSLDLVLSFFLLFVPFCYFCLAFCTLYSLLMLLCHCPPHRFSFCFPAASLILQSRLHLRQRNKTLLLLLNQVVFVLGNERVMPSNSLILEIGLGLHPGCLQIAFSGASELVAQRNVSCGPHPAPGGRAAAYFFSAF